MPTIIMERGIKENNDLRIQKFNEFIRDNIEFIKQITPMNPTISKDDEWRTDDYSEYDKIKEQINKE